VLIQGFPEPFEQGAGTVVFAACTDPDRRRALRCRPLPRQGRLSVAGWGSDQRGGRKHRMIDEIEQPIPDDDAGR